MSQCGNRGRGRMGGRGRVPTMGMVLLFAAWATRSLATPLVIDFEASTPRDPGLESYWDPNPGFTADGASFSGGTYAGFVVSSSTTSGPGSTYLFFGSEAEISAQANGGAGGGVGGSSNFAVAYNGGSFFNLPAGYRPASVYLTNTATAYDAILNGLFQASPFAAGDWFRVRLTGYSAAAGAGVTTGVPVDFYLADYRAGQTLIVDSWTSVDLSPLGEAKSIVLSFASTDNDPDLDPLFAMNTPAYVALDNVTLVPVPEPSGMVLAGCCGVFFAGVALRRRRARCAGASTAGW